MLLLVSTSDKLQVITSAAATVDVHASYMDYNGSTVTPGRLNKAISTATTTDVVESPGSGVQRNVRQLAIRNKHASLSTDVTVRHTDGTTALDVYKVALASGDVLQYVEGVGFFITRMGVPGLITKALASDQSNSTVTLTEVTGLTQATLVGTYVFRYDIVYRSSATGTGVAFSVNHDGTVTTMVWNWGFVDNTAAGATAAADQDAIGATGQVKTWFSSRLPFTTQRGVGVSVDTADADMYATIEGMFVCTVAGNLELWHGSETAAATTIKANSALRLWLMGQ
jgi:hypothetical protein